MSLSAPQILALAKGDEKKCEIPCPHGFRFSARPLKIRALTVKNQRNPLI